MLKINNLKVEVEDKIILENFNLELKDGEVHALMGKNGAGKSTISKVIMRDPRYIIKEGEIFYNDKNILDMDTTNVSKLGIYMVSQNPIEIEGVTNAEMLRVALQNLDKKQDNVLEFNKKLISLCEKLNIPKEFIHRDINYNMSGGEKKKNELLHMYVLEPNFIILDEIDSGLDVDNLKNVAKSILEYKEEYKPTILVITHQQSLLEILKPDYVHIIDKQKIIKSGNYDLALNIFKNGFDGTHDITGSESCE